MPRTYHDSWQTESPGDARATDGAPERTAGLKWLRGPVPQDAAFSPPVASGEAPRRHPFTPLGLTVLLNGLEQSRQLIGGTLLQRRPIGRLRAFNFQVSLFSSQFVGFGVITRILRGHDAQD